MPLIITVFVCQPGGLMRYDAKAVSPIRLVLFLAEAPAWRGHSKSVQVKVASTAGTPVPPGPRTCQSNPFLGDHPWPGYAFSCFKLPPPQVYVYSSGPPDGWGAWPLRNFPSEYMLCTSSYLVYGSPSHGIIGTFLCAALWYKVPLLCLPFV